MENASLNVNVLIKKRKIGLKTTFPYTIVTLYHLLSTVVMSTAQTTVIELTIT